MISQLGAAYGAIPVQQKKWIKTLTGVLIIVLILGVLIWGGNKLIRKWIANSRASKGKQAPVDSSLLLSDRNYGSYALALYEALEGFTFINYSQKKEAVENWMALNDEEFKHVHNIFSKNYSQRCWTCDASTTLRTWLKEDAFIGVDLNAIYERMNRLELP